MTVHVPVIKSPSANISGSDSQSKSVGSHHNKLAKYAISNLANLKRSSQLWKDIEKQRQETGVVDKRKMATLEVFM